MFKTITVKQGARSDALFHNVGYSLVGHTDARFSMRNKLTDALVIDNAAAVICDGTFVIEDKPVVLSPHDGWVSYPWADLDVATAGVFLGEFALTDPNGLPKFEPQGNEYLNVIISRRLSETAPIILPLPAALVLTSTAANTARLTFTAAAGAVSYEAQAGIEASGTFPIAQAGAGSPIDFASLPAGIYRARVRAVFVGPVYGAWVVSPATVTVADLPLPSAVAITSPADGAARVTFTAATGAVSHEIQIGLESAGTFPTMTTGTSPIDFASVEGGTYRARVRAVFAGPVYGAWVLSAGTVAVAQAMMIAGVALGAPGGAGTIYEGFKLAAGDDFDAVPTRWHGRNLTGKYAHSALSFGFRGTNPAQDRAMYIDPAYRGPRSESPTDLGYDRASVASSVLTLLASPPEAGLVPFLPTTYTGGRGDGANKPQLVSGGIKTAPSFMLSAQADWVIECKVRMQGGIVRGYWPSFWTTSFFWPDFGEVDIVEGRKNGSGAINSEMNLHASATDGGGVILLTVANPAYPAARWVTVVSKRQGGTIFFYDDAAVEGTLALRGSTTTRVDRVRGAHDIRLDQAVSTVWDGSTFNLADWPADVDFDWWRAWVPAAAARANLATNVLTPVLTTPGGSWAASFPAAATLHGAAAGLEQVSAAWDGLDAPGMPTRSSTTRLPTSMTVNLGTRAITGTVPTTEGGCMGVFVTYAYDDGSPVSRVMLPYYVAPAVQNLAASWNYAPAASISETIAYTDFHSGNLGPHIYNVTAPGLTVTGNGTGSVTITGTAAANVTVTINCTNSVGQTTSVTRTLTVSAGANDVNDTFTGEADGTDLIAHTGEAGATWTRHPSAPSGTILMANSGGTVYPGVADLMALYIASAAPASANGTVTGTFTAKSVPAGSNVSNLGVVGRCDPTAATFYMARIVYLNPGYHLQLFKSVAGVLTQLGSNVTLAWTTNQTRNIALRMTGTTIEALVDGVSQISVTDAAITAAGRYGLRAYAFTGATPTTNFHATAIVSS